MIDEVSDCLLEFPLSNKPVCSHLDHAKRPISLPLQQNIERAATLFRAMGEPSRLKLLALLDQGESCVGDITETLADKLSSISQRLKVLRAEGLLVRRREGKHLSTPLPIIMFLPCYEMLWLMQTNWKHLIPMNQSNF